jgi:carbonic anhydrase
MQNLIDGLHTFQRDQFPAKRELFGRLADGQSPTALVITCSDSRIDPNLVMQAEPGQLFVLRNIGNIVPPHGQIDGGAAAAIEYAVVALGVPNIIVCGHSGCGAMAGLIEPEKLEAMPGVAAWLQHAATVRESLADTGSLDGPGALERAVDANVILQLGHLRTHPCVADALADGRLALHGWVYEIASGEVRVYDESWRQFAPL